VSRRSSELLGVARKENGYLTGPPSFPFPISHHLQISTKKKNSKVGA
jgi:hypothetical protein